MSGASAGDAGPWTEKGRADLRSARWELERPDQPNLDAAGFHAQQAVEKLLKAALVALGQTPPRTHDLVHLADLLTRAGSRWSWSPEELAYLSQAGVAVRYPGVALTRDEAARLVVLAERIWDAPPVAI